MKNVLSLVCWILVTTSGAFAQLKGTCSTCFESQIVQATKVDAQCTDYVIKVSYIGKCEHDLSHFTVAVPSCASIQNLTNSQHYTSTIGYDPTTGLTGFKINNTTNFGSCAVKDFTVSFRLCASSSCPQLQCWSPQVAYKAGNCFELDTIQAPCPVLKAHLQKKNVTCPGSSDGQLTAIIDDGISPFQYTWSNGSTQSSIQNVSAGPYSVVIKDNTGSQITLYDTISQPKEILISSLITNATCQGMANGSIQLKVSGGNGTPYTFLWNNGSTSTTLANIATGGYVVTVKDSLGCSKQASFFVGTLKNLTASATTQLPACNQSNGSISVTATGGTEPYSYSWSNGATTSSLINLPQGTYSVTITDAEGCTFKATYFLRENNTLRLSYLVTPTTCLNDASGAINLNVTGGTQPYTFTWSNGATTENINGLSSGIYNVIVKDSLGCQQAARIFVFKQTFQVNAQITQPKCAGDATGSISLTSLGGVAPYQYSWSTGDTSSSLQNLSAGVYSVTVTDSTGCSRILSYSIVSPSPILATISNAIISCNNYSLNLALSGGSAPYQFLWSTGATTQNITSVPSGTYSVTITDINGCTLTKQITIDDPNSWSCLISTITTSISCNSNGNLIYSSVVGASSYSWSVTSTDGSWSIQTGSQSDTLQFTAGNANTSATFSLTIVKNGCTQTCSYKVSSCSSTSSPGGENNESCGDCFKSVITKTTDNGSCATYQVNISTDGNCRYDLSHFVVAIPCGEISNYSDSGNWPLVLGKDPRTGLTGLKVDNVSNFGKTLGSFTLQFTVCYSSDCGKLLQNWNPAVAYKAGLCIAYDTLNLNSGSSSISLYPNPCKESVNIEIQCSTSESASIELYDQYGRSVCNPIVKAVESGKNNFTLETSGLLPSIYFCRVKVGDSYHSSRIIKVKD